MARREKAGGWRGSAEVWLNAAHDLLLEQGVDAVKILALAERLNLSRTSFYWFFKDHQHLLDALVARWAERNTGNLITQTQTYAESLTEAVLNVFDLWLDPSLFDSRLEFAVRSWALNARGVLHKVQQADQLRLAALKQMFMRFGVSDMVADVRARTIYLVQIGYISMQTQEDAQMRLTRIPHYAEIFAGRAATESELNRFCSRHGLSRSGLALQQADGAD